VTASPAPRELFAVIDVDDLGRAIGFYTAAFGLRVGRVFGKGAAELLGAPITIHLLHKPATTKPTPVAAITRHYRRHWTPVHLDFVVDDVEAAVARAVAAGAQLEGGIQTLLWGRMALLADPFGHGFCLLQFLGRGYGEIAD
jgi:predicted enzyme related to lactoylglutathione lyase